MDKPLIRTEHTLLNPAPSMGITFLESGYCYRNRNQPILNNPWIRREYLLVYLQEGRGKLESSHTGLVELKRGDLFLIPPGVWHRYGPEEGQEWYEYWILFEGTLAESLLMQVSRSIYTQKHCLLFHSEESSGLEKLMHDCFAEAGENNPMKCTALLFEIMQRMELISKPPVYRKENAAVNSVLRLIHANPAGNVDFEKEASALGISYALLRKEFVKRTGMPPYRYLLNHRMQYACNLLADGRSVKETCYEIGMEDPSHFSKLFKKTIGIAPGNFIEKVRR